MTTNYMEKESSKKKYLAPLVVIMLCLVAITGAAYAYSTTVTGNGDIAGKYTVIDLYDKGDATTAEGVSNFQITSSSFQVRTEADKTGSTNSYVAYVEPTNLVYYGYVRINTTNGETNTDNSAANEDATTEKFTLSGALKYTKPTSAGTIKVDSNDGSSTEFINFTENASLKAYATSDTSHTSPLDTLEADTMYYVVITLPLTGGDNDTFGTYNDFDKVKAAVNAFNTADTPELAIKLTATSSA